MENVTCNCIFRTDLLKKKEKKRKWDSLGKLTLIFIEIINDPTVTVHVLLLGT